MGEDRSMKARIVRAVMLCLIGNLLFCASDNLMSPTEAGDTRSNFPAAMSIIPLAVESEWRYRTNEFDQNGEPETPSRVSSFDLHVRAAFGLLEDSSLIQFGDSADSTKTACIDTFYSYHYPLNGRALLLGYWNSNNHPEIDTPGLYVVGSHFPNTDSVSLLKDPYLWLAYPSEVGTKWKRVPGTGDSGTVLTELVSKKEPFFTTVAEPDGLIPGDTVHCYLYKERVADTTWYRYFHPEYGEVGALMFLHGVRRKVYTLDHYRRGW